MKKKMSLQEATIKELYKNIDDIVEEQNTIDTSNVDGVVDGVLVLTDPDVTNEEYNEIIDLAQDIIEDTPEGDIPFMDSYIGEYAQICPICGSTFTDSHMLEPGTACPICGEVPESFVFVGKLESDEEEEIPNVSEEDLESVENIEEPSEEEQNEEPMEQEETEEETEPERGPERDLASKQIHGNKLQEEKDDDLELPSTKDGTVKKEIQDMLDRAYNREYKVGIEESKNLNEDMKSGIETLLNRFKDKISFKYQGNKRSRDGKYYDRFLCTIKKLGTFDLVGFEDKLKELGDKLGVILNVIYPNEKQNHSSFWVEGRYKNAVIDPKTVEYTVYESKKVTEETDQNYYSKMNKDDKDDFEYCVGKLIDYYCGKIEIPEDEEDDDTLSGLARTIEYLLDTINISFSSGEILRIIELACNKKPNEYNYSIFDEVMKNLGLYNKLTDEPKKVTENKDLDISYILDSDEDKVLGKYTEKSVSPNENVTKKSLIELFVEYLQNENEEEDTNINYKQVKKDLEEDETLRSEFLNYVSQSIEDGLLILNESKKVTESKTEYKIYLLCGENGVYNSQYKETVSDLEQAIDRVSELEAETGCTAYYKEVVDGKELDESKKVTEEISENEVIQLHNDIENAEDMDEIQQLIYTISDGVLEDEVQLAFDQCEADGDDLDVAKDFIISTLEDNAEYLDESKKVTEAKKVIKVPVSWEMYGYLEVEADSIEEAKRIVENNDFPLPDGEYVENTFKVDNEGLSELNESKKITEERYEDPIFQEVEDAFTEAGLNFTRFNDAGILTNNLGWIVEGENGSLELTCDGTYLEESKKVTESSTEQYWDATEIDRDGFMTLLKFNFGYDSRGNNYIVTVDANDVKRFFAESDEEAKEIYKNFRKDWHNSDHPDLTMNIKSIAPRNESRKVIKSKKQLNENVTPDKEIDVVKTMIKNNIMKSLLDTTNYIKENITSENPETSNYTEEQIDSLDALNLYLETEYKNFEKVSNNLINLFSESLIAKTINENVQESNTDKESESKRYILKPFSGPGATYGVWDTEEEKFLMKGNKSVMAAAVSAYNDGKFNK